MMMRQFEIYVQNRPGEVAWIAEILAKNSVNIRGISTDLGSNRPMIRVITDDENSARSALKNAGLEFSERDVLVVSLSDRPGELSKLTKKLARAGINIESIFILGARTPREEIAIGVDQPEKAAEVLAKYTS
ncbi:MAG: ACT domain-containing protein [Methanomassiliicoccales archaeon]|nr:ACT domain-containing protein [Methanomassiliicoccales archaeon]